MQDHTTPDRLYIVSRADLPIGLQAAQAAHAAFAFAKEFPHVTREWMLTSNFIVLVSVQDEKSLEALAQHAEKVGLAVARNYEPDIDDELTAIVLEPGAAAKRLCQALPLMGAEMAH